MKKKDNEEIVAFGMTKNELLSLSDIRAEQKDANCPKNSGSYTDFVKVAISGREKLSKGSYCKKSKKG